MTLPQLPPLNLVRAFHAVAHAGSMRKGAHGLGVSHTVASRNIRALEAYLGTKLLERRTTGVRLTEQGQVLFTAAQNALVELEAAMETLRPQMLASRLVVWAMPGLAARWLSPRLNTIGRLLPGVELSVRASDVVPDFAASEADVFIGFGAPDTLPTHADIVVTPRMFPVASPLWLSRNGVPRDLETLAQQPLIHENDHRQWTQWLKAAGVSNVPPLKGPRLWNASLGLDAAASHQGIALATQLSVAGDIAEGRLVEVLSSAVTTGSYFTLVAPEKRHRSHVLQFIAWLKQAMAS